MSKLLITAIVNLCLNSSYTKAQQNECVIFFGSCVADYETESKAINECSKKWEKVKDTAK